MTARALLPVERLELLIYDELSVGSGMSGGHEKSTTSDPRAGESRDVAASIPVEPGQLPGCGPTFQCPRGLSRVSVPLAEALTLAAEGRVAVFSRPPGRSELRTAQKGVGRSAALREQGAGVSSVGETQRATVAPATAPTAPLPAPRETDQFAARRGNVGAEGAPGSGCIHPSFPSSRGQARPSAPALFPEAE